MGNKAKNKNEDKIIKEIIIKYKDVLEGLKDK